MYQELDRFETSIEEKCAFECFTNKRPRTIPNMVMKRFRHQLCESSALISALRQVPLKKVEAVVKSTFQQHKNILCNTFSSMLTALIGDSFSRIEAQDLFCFFDTDGDDDLDLHEACNGFVLVLSEDGSLVTVLHRCKAILQPSALKDTRLSFISRFELMMMTEAIKHVMAKNAPV